MHLRILSRVLLIEVFDLQGKELKCWKKIFLNHYGKPLQSSTRLQYMCAWVDLKLKSRTSCVRYFEVIYTRQQNTLLQ